MARGPKIGTEHENVLAYPPFHEILERLDRLPRQQRRVADAVLQNPELIAFHSIRDVADAVGANNATIVRFAQAFDYNGYPEFQAAVRLAYLQHTGATPGVTKASAALRSSSDSVDFTRGQQRTNLEIAQNQFANADVQAISACISGARRVIVYAEAGAEPCGLLLSRLLRQVRIFPQVATSPGDAIIALHDAGAGDAYITLSQSLTFRSSVAALKLAKRKGVSTIAIVGNETSPLVREATYAIPAPSSSATLWYSSVALVGVIELLVAHMAGERTADALFERQAMYDNYLDEHLLASFEAESPPK
jgi:DNA-binding MurR/RpiR family transcriptional regulator